MFGEKNISFHFELQDGVLIKKDTKGLIFLENDRFFAWHKGLTQEGVNEILNSYIENNLKEVLIKREEAHFLCFFYDKESKELFSITDMFGNHEVLHSQNDSKITISNDLNSHNLDGKPQINKERIFQFLAFSSIPAPYTVFENIELQPAATILSASEIVSIDRYWNPSFFSGTKIKDYAQLVRQLKEAFSRTITPISKESKSAIALSGGVDSAGVLGFVSSASNKEVESITISFDDKDPRLIQGAKMSADYANSSLSVVKPEFKDIQKLKEYVARVNQPVDGTALMTAGLIFDGAHEKGAELLWYGFGVDMILGNQKYSKFSHKVRFLDWIFYIPGVSYIVKSLRKILKISENQARILTEPRWYKRFLYIKAPLFWREGIYRVNGELPYESIYKKELRDVFKTKNSRIDQLIHADWLMLHRIRQTTYLSAMGNSYGIQILSPAYSPLVARAILKTPDSIRKRDSWNKTLIRDAFADYFPEEIIRAPRGACIFPYDRWVDENKESFFKYLSASDFSKQYVDIEKLEKRYNQLPERGHLIIRLTALSLWYDTRWSKENISLFDSIFEK